MATEAKVIANDFGRWLRLICQCGTIWPICEMPISIDEMVKAMNEAKCPTCNKDTKLACVYVEKGNE